VKNIKIPHVFIFLSILVFITSVLTYIVPSGQYDRTIKVVNHAEQTVVVPGTYQEMPKHVSLKGVLLEDNKEGYSTPISFLGLFTAIPKGMDQAAVLIFFVFIIGAVISLIKHTGTIDVFVFLMLKIFSKHPTVLIFILFISFALAAAFLGMGTEFIALVPLLLLVSRELGYDRVFGVGIFLSGQGVGWASGITNPFNLQIAQSVAELPLGSGMGLRILTFILFAAIGFFFLMRYGRRIKKDPSKSCMPDDPFLLEGSLDKTVHAVQRKHIWIAITAAIMFGAILFAVQTLGWDLIEMTGGFLALGLITILISGMSGHESMSVFVRGLEMMIVPALIIGFARGIQVVLVEGQIIDTILFHTEQLLKEFNQTSAVLGIYAFQSVFNFLIPSASGQALVTMPLFTPLADLIGVSRQTAVLAFIFGDGISNLVIPTNGFLMAVISVAGVPFEKWFKFIWRTFVALTLAGAIMLVIAQVIHY
jgi:uncharacterized ion transporter superfamily protein YfcC